MCFLTVMLPSEIPNLPTDLPVRGFPAPPSQLPLQVRSPSLTLLSFFLSFIFCPTSFQREWAAFLSAWCPPPAFRNCFVEVSQHSNDLLTHLWGRKWSPCPIPPPSWDCPPLHCIFKHNTVAHLIDYMSLCMLSHSVVSNSL